VPSRLVRNAAACNPFVDVAVICAQVRCQGHAHILKKSWKTVLMPAFIAGHQCCYISWTFIEYCMFNRFEAQSLTASIAVPTPWRIHNRSAMALVRELRRPVQPEDQNHAFRSSRIVDQRGCLRPAWGIFVLNWIVMSRIAKGAGCHHENQQRHADPGSRPRISRTEAISAPVATTSKIAVE